MNLRQLEYLAALAHERHFGRAAVACHVSQPALSTAIAKLEGELGLQLVRRGGRVAELTDEGRALLPWARDALAATGALAAEATRLRGHLTGTLRLGVIATAQAAASAVVGPLLRAHPGVRVEIRSLTAERIADALRGHELDAGLAYVDTPATGLTALRLYRERLVLVSSSRRAGAAELPWARIADEPLCLLAPDMQHRRVVDAALARAGVVVHPRVEAEAIGILLDLVADGLSTVVGRPWLAGRALPPGVRATPLVRPVVAPWVGLLTTSGPVSTPVVSALRASLRATDVAAALAGAEPTTGPGPGPPVPGGAGRGGLDAGTPAAGS